MTDLNTLPEVISKDLFLSLLEELLQNREQHSAEEQAGQLALLGEKFQKFYDPDIINGAQRTAIFEILKTATDTGRLQLMEALIGIMFQYRLDAYALYMEALLPTIISATVYQEVYDSILEYKAGSNGHH